MPGSSAPTTRFNKLYTLNDQLHELATRQMMSDLKRPDNKSFFAAFIQGKAYKTHEAAMLLCEKQYGEDAFILSRTLFELMVLLLYILADNTEERLMRYVEYDWINRKEMLNYVVTKDEILKSINEKIDSGVVESEVLDTINTEYERVRNKHKYDPRRGWSDKTIQGMAEEIGRVDAYRTVYKLQCIVSHTSPRSMNEYIHHTNEGFIINVGPNSDMTEMVLIAAFDFFGTIFEKAGKQLGWDVEHKLDELSKKFVKLI